MNASGVVTATFCPATGVSRLVVPAWVRNPTAMPRTDGRDELTILATRRFPEEQWLILPDAVDRCTLYSFVLLGEGVEAAAVGDVQVGVLVPRQAFADFSVTPYTQ